MSQLFYHLIYHEKTKRWLLKLDQLEESQTVTGKDLATKLSCTQRTIQSDIKQIKKYFDASILLLDGEDGYHFSFRSPTAYIRKKHCWMIVTIGLIFLVIALFVYMIWQKNKHQKSE